MRPEEETPSYGASLQEDASFDGHRFRGGLPLGKGRKMLGPAPRVRRALRCVLPVSPSLIRAHAFPVGP